ncbi:MAG: alkaline phosphatase family protein [Actinobacteria bacterium]|nr:alkaline phosphatase family protein [Actinomycetota bacterium]MCL6104392.1 alkaline phosphatase family protein [Actinomycetota bacterium]
MEQGFSRRELFKGSLAFGGLIGTGALAGACATTPHISKPAVTTTTVPLNLRHPGSLPNPSLAAGTPTMEQVDHIVVLMLENRSFDSLLGMSGRGNGFTLGSNGLPTATNPNGHGDLIKSFHSPTECRSESNPTQSWNDSHTAYDNGTNQGFVLASGPSAMAYWDDTDIPFIYWLAKTFPLCDSWFCSLLGPTFPNRRYLISGTSLGTVSDKLINQFPPNGTIFNSLNNHNISWMNYHANPSGTFVTLSMYGNPLDIVSTYKSNIAPISQFYADVANGTLPSFSLIDPNWSTNSEGEGQDIQFGDQFLAQVVTAILNSPKWDRTLFVYTYDEHGGYYDHVPPPPAVKPDNIAPEIKVPPDKPGGFDRYGFRVPAGIVSPYAKGDYVSSVVYDHTSVLKLIETKWNLPALTYRDANAADLLDCLDFSAPPTFLTPPAAPTPINPAIKASCLNVKPYTSKALGMPPPGAVVKA